MRRTILLSLLAATLLVLVCGSVQAQHTRPFTMTLSGTANVPLATEANGVPINFSLCGGKTNLPGGSVECTTTGYRVTQPVGLNTPSCPDGLEVEVVDAELNHIVRFANGDMMYWVYDLTRDNYFCFSAGGATGPENWLIIGGSGMYEGATGSVTWYLRVDNLPLGEHMMFGVHDTLAEGTVTIAN